ncbi:MAG: iron-containing alcohol dehydrogenase [Candidatus Heimdallarchaeota archaeon]|nr:iron-containing alcohol dehydrogenase [Candidatus Heimdallarchaeota archaeon]
MSEELTFDFLTTPQIVFGKGRFQEIGELLDTYGKKVLVVCSESAFSQIQEQIEKITANRKISYEVFIIKGEPDIHQIDKGVEQGIKQKANVVLGVGGGSAVDAGKAIAGLITNGGLAKDYMEVIGKGSLITKPPLPYIAIPTTAGTGSEVTKNAVILSKEDGLKASIRSPLLIPKVALVDPELMIKVSPEVTAYCGLDALTQLIESYTSVKSQPITDSLAILGIRRITKSLIYVYENGHDVSAREDMAFAALLSGICLANAGLGVVHGFASPIGGLVGIPHGVVCGALLSFVVEENIKQMITEIPFNETLAKYATLGELLANIIFDDIREAADRVIEYTEQISRLLKIPKLSKYGLSEKYFEEIIEKAKKTSSMRYNPVKLSDEALYRILLKSM